MEKLRVDLFGRFNFASESGNNIKIEGTKALELFCFLLLFRHWPQSRDVMAEMLWKDHTGNQPRSYLRRTLWHLQHSLESQVQHLKQPLLLVEQDWLQLNPNVPLWLDVDVLENAYQQVKGVPGEELDQLGFQVLTEATDLYRGQLLEGWYQTWCIYERERLQHIYLVMLDKLMRYCEGQGDLEAGIAYGQRILRIDQAREYTHRQLMRLLYFAHDRSGALRQYDRCVSALREELDVKPTRRTQILYERICQDNFGMSVSERWDSQHLAHTDHAKLHQLLVELENMQLEIDCLTRRITHTSDIVNGLLKPPDTEKIAS
jgi:DNA-binding SARP family transcriptional activator